MPIKRSQEIKTSDEKVLEALNIIKNVCKENECKDCPFVMDITTSQSCNMATRLGIPSLWKINSGPPRWRAF